MTRREDTTEERDWAVRQYMGMGYSYLEALEKWNTYKGGSTDGRKDLPEADQA